VQTPRARITVSLSIFQERFSMYELKVDGMTCGGCAASVKRALQALDAKANVDVDLADKRVRIETTAQLDAVKSAIEDAGYEVSGAA
jgi:copper chaperone